MDAHHESLDETPAQAWGDQVNALDADMVTLHDSLNGEAKARIAAEERAEHIQKLHAGILEDQDRRYMEVYGRAVAAEERVRQLERAANDVLTRWSSTIGRAEKLDAVMGSKWVDNMDADCNALRAALTGATADPLGGALAMRVLQSDLYPKLDDKERAECDALIHNFQRALVSPEVAR